MKVYDFEASQKVIKEAWELAVNHLKTTLGEQYDYRSTKFAWEKFQDYSSQDITEKKVCPNCGEIDIEGNFTTHSLYKDGGIEVCYSCYEDLGEE